jgi:hypothetical protein
MSTQPKYTRAQLAQILGTHETVLAALIRDHLNAANGDFDDKKITEGGAEKLRRVLHGEPWQQAEVLAKHPNPKALRALTQKEGGGVMAVDVWGKNTLGVSRGRKIRIRMEAGRWVSKDF